MLVDTTQDQEMLHFLYHEFKTPLFMFKSLVSMMLDGQVPDETLLRELLVECEKYEVRLKGYLDPTPAPPERGIQELVFPNSKSCLNS